MPYELNKVKNYYKVINQNDGKVKAKHTTREKGKRMIRLLNYIDAKKIHTLTRKDNFYNIN